MPTDDVADVYRACIAAVRDDELRGRLETIVDQIAVAGETYAAAGRRAEFHTIAAQLGGVGAVTAQELADVYELRMAKKGSRGRPYYDRFVSPEKCPLCGQRRAATLDHYLPQKQHPALVVTPCNLVPACRDCNTIKLAYTPTNPGEQTLHPYFDDLGNEQWVFAEIQETSPPVALFQARPPAHWPAVRQSRARFHFAKFELRRLYGSHAGEEISEIRQSVANLSVRSGAAAVRGWLQEQAESRGAVFVNSWRAALYQALASSDWYCNGGFRGELTAGAPQV